jgi:NADH-quinone oxidoreductase subunit G/NADP-reducing hydrogenase subunit HndD
MITFEANNRKIEARKGETILTALTRAGIKVPTLCHMATHENLFPSGACRMCVVEVDGQRNLIPSCAFPVADGMKIKTHSPRVVRARKTIIELILASHPDDCLYCVRNGGCELQGLAGELGVRDRRFAGTKVFDKRYHEDTSSPSLVRDPAKCVLCGRCVRVCEEVQGVAAIDFVGRGSKVVVGTAFDQGLNLSSCVNCGQCIMVCPTGALREQSHLKEVLSAINDPNMIVIAQHAPSVSVTIAEEFGLKPGTDVAGAMTAALRKLGFDRVFDTGFGADLTIMEEASELVHRVRNGGVLPMMTSCSPGWIKFVEQFYPDYLPNLSSCKSPQQMTGAIIKSHYAQRENIDPSRIFSVSIMPCTAKKFEAGRAEMVSGATGMADVDAVLTTRELARLIRLYGLNLAAMAPEQADTPFGDRSTAGKIFGATGGVMEAAIRTAHFMITGQELDKLEYKDLRGLTGIKEARIKIGGLEIGVAVASGLSNARKIMEELKAGRRDLHFIEIMTCPGGCIAGGGQPLGTNTAAVRARMQALYKIDRDEAVRTSHSNPAIVRIYKEFLGAPLGEKSHQLLHTHYAKREAVL